MSKDLLTDIFKDRSVRAVEPAWLAAVRERSTARLSEAGLPNRRVETWRFTDLKRKLSGPFRPAEPGAGAPLAPAFADLEATRLVVRNGFAEAGDIEAAQGIPGARVLSFAQALLDEPALIEAHFGKGGAAPAIFDMNAAFATDGVVVMIEGGAAIARPILIDYQTTDGDAAAAHARTLIVLGEGARATVIERHGGGDGAYLSNVVTDISLAKGAALTRVVAQGEGAQAAHLAGDVVTLGAGARYDFSYFADGAALWRREGHIALLGEGATALFSGCGVLHGAQHGDVTMVVDHRAPGCDSVETYKAAVRDEARSVFQGKIVVARGAQKTDAHMGTHALLLSDGAEADSKPELEIYADDVKCAHGATVGDIDDDALFYMRSRGVPESAARALLIEAFLAETLDAIAPETVRDELYGRLTAWLGESEAT